MVKMAAPQPRMNSVPNPMFTPPGPPQGQYGPPGQVPNMPGPGPMQTPPKMGPPGNMAQPRYMGSPMPPPPSGGPGTPLQQTLPPGHPPGMYMNRTPPPPSSTPTSANLPRNFSAPANVAAAGLTNGSHSPMTNGPPSAGAPGGGYPGQMSPAVGGFPGQQMPNQPPSFLGARPPTGGPPGAGPPFMGARPPGPAPPGMPPTGPPIGPPSSRPPGPAPTGAPLMGAPPMARPPGPPGPPMAGPPMTGPPSSMAGPPHMGGPQPPMGGPPQNHAGPPPHMGGPPQNMGGPPPGGYNYTSGPANGPQGLPAPFHGQANYSHQLHENHGVSQGPTPSNSAPVSQRSSANPSPVTAMQYDSLEGQFSPEAGAGYPRMPPQPGGMPHQPGSPQGPQYAPTSQPSPHAPPSGGITGRRHYPQMPATPPAHNMGYPTPPQPGQQMPMGGNYMKPQQPMMPGSPGTHPYQQQPGGPHAMQNNIHQNNIAALGTDLSGLNLHESRTVNLLQERHLIPTTGLDNKEPNLPHDYKKVNCNPDIFRCTLTSIPKTSSLLNKSRLPLGIIIHPFRDLSQLPVIQSSVIVRCRLCRTYINPFVTFADMRRWKCNLCNRVNELPEEFNYDPVSRSYGEPQRRPEIRSSTIEFIAPSEYMLRPPQPAVYLYVLDVSFSAIQTGYLEVFCRLLSEEIDRIPGDSRTQIGFITFDHSLHFYNLSEGLSQPQMMVVSDVEEIFLPCPDGLLVNLQESKDLVLDLLDRLPQMFDKNLETGSALGSALQTAYKLMHATGGRVSVFQTLLPTVGPGALKNREDPNERAGKHVQNMGPATDFYKKLALECSAQQICVDMFLLSAQYADFSTLSCISKYSGGCLYHFPGLHTKNNPAERERFRGTLRRYVTRKIGFEAVMRIRCSRGLSIHTFHGNFFVRSTDLLSLPNINPDAGFGMHMAIEDDLDGSTACFQAALLYTSSKGERRIRVHTLCLPVTTSLQDVFLGADQLAIVGMLAKMGVDKCIAQSMSDAREAMINASLDMIRAYGTTLASSQRVGQLPIIFTLRCVPLFIISMLKYAGFRINASTKLDDRVAALEQCKTLPLQYLLMELYPHLYPLHNLQDYVMQSAENEDDTALPTPDPPRLQLSCANMDRTGAYLMDTGSKMYLYVCSAISDHFCQAVLGMRNFQSIVDGMAELPELENPASQQMHAFITHLNDQRPYPPAFYIIREDSRLKVWFHQHMVEDRTESSMSYYEFLQSLQKDVK